MTEKTSVLEKKPKSFENLNVLGNQGPSEKKTFYIWFHSRKIQKRLVMFTFMFLPIALLGIFTYYPFTQMIDFSFHKMKWIGAREWVGFKNYIDVFKREDCFGALKNSLYYMGGAVFQLCLALYLATILSFGVKVGKFFKGLMFFPYLINGIAIGFIFKFFYTRGFVLDTVLQAIGLNIDNLPYWLKDQSINNVSLAATSVWKYFGQNMVLFVGAIMSVDSELYEAATLDGANKWQQFCYIILPSIKTIVLLNLILSITGSLSAFEPAFVITDSANGTGTYFTTMHEIAYTSQKVGLAAAMAVILFGMIILATIFQKVLFAVLFKNAEIEDKKGGKKRENKINRMKKRKGVI